MDIYRRGRRGKAPSSFLSPFGAWQTEKEGGKKGASLGRRRGKESRLKSAHRPPPPPPPLPRQEEEAKPLYFTWRRRRSLFLPRSVGRPDDRRRERPNERGGGGRGGGERSGGRPSPVSPLSSSLCVPSGGGKGAPLLLSSRPSPSLPPSELSFWARPPPPPPPALRRPPSLPPSPILERVELSGGPIERRRGF